MFNHGTRHLDGQQRHVVDSKIDAEKKRKAEFEKNKKDEKLALDIFKDIYDGIDNFLNGNQDKDAEVVMNPDLFKKIKKFSPKDAFREGHPPTIYKKNIILDKDVDSFIIRGCKKY